MDGKRFRCRHCGKLKAVRVLGQRYCGDAACQQGRRNRWRREKTASEADYRLNQRASTEAWLAGRGGAAAYHRAYRERRRRSTGEVDGGVAPKAAVRRKQSTVELKDADEVVSAKRDGCFGDMPMKTGRYVLFSELAKRDGYLVEIRFISSG